MLNSKMRMLFSPKCILIHEKKFLLTRDVQFLQQKLKVSGDEVAHFTICKYLPYSENVFWFTA